MTTKDAIAFCHYYKGENESPFTEKEKSFLWDYEQAWVAAMVNEKSLEEYIGDYVLYGLGDFQNDDGVPLSLKAVLFNRFTKSFHSTESAVVPFMAFYKHYY